MVAMAQLEIFASRIDGREYRDEVTEEVAAELKSHNCVAIFGRSDDTVVVAGAFSEEIDAYDGVTFVLNCVGAMVHKDDHDEEGWTLNEAREYLRREALPHGHVHAKWGISDRSWTMETPMHSAAFMIMDEEGDEYCQGLVVSLEPFMATES